MEFLDENAMVFSGIAIYNYDDYPNSDELYTKMKESGLDKLYTKKWFDKQFKFIGNQLNEM